MKRFQQRQVILACALLAFGLQLGIGFFFYWQERQLHVTQAERARTAQVDKLFDDALSGLKDAETGQRGFLLTGNPDYLPPYWQALRHIDTAFTRLRQLSASPHSGWHPMLDRVEALAHAKLAELKQTIDLQEDGRSVEAMGIVRTHRGQLLMQAIRQEVAAIKADEQRRLRADDHYLSGLDQQIHWTAAVAGLFSMLLFGASFFLLNRQVKLRSRSEQALRIAEEAARNSQARLERALSAAGLALSEQDAQNGAVWDWNLSGPMLGHDSHPPHTFQELLARIHPDDRNRLLADQQKVRDGAGMVRTEYRLFGDHGHPYWLATRTSAVAAAGNGPLTLICATKDITEQKQAEEKLYETRQMLQLILDNVPQRIFWKDTQLNYLGCNLQFARDAAIETPAAIVGQDDYDMPWQQEADRYRADDRTAMREGCPRLSYEELQSRPDGSPRWLLTSKIPLHNPAGEIIGVLGTYEDITVRKQVEKELRHSEERLRIITDNVPALIGYYDRDERYAFVNATYEKWFNRSPGELPGRKVRDVIGEAAYAVAAPYIQRALAGAPVTYEFSIQGEDTPRAVQASYIPHFSPAGMVIGVYVLAYDITALKQAEDKLAHMAQYDALTDLPNRRLLRDRLRLAVARCSRKGKLAALMYLDIDYFKQINDGMGHDTGDALLKAFASRLKGAIRETDTVARLGGDEFVILVEELAHPEDASRIAGKILQQIQEAFVCGTATLRISSSIGIGFIDGTVADIDGLLKQADEALYAAKKAGRNRYHTAAGSVAG